MTGEKDGKKKRRSAFNGADYVISGKRCQASKGERLEKAGDTRGRRGQQDACSRRRGAAAIDRVTEWHGRARAGWMGGE